MVKPERYSDQIIDLPFPQYSLLFWLLVVPNIPSVVPGENTICWSSVGVVAREGLVKNPSLNQDHTHSGTETHTEGPAGGSAYVLRC